MEKLTIPFLRSVMFPLLMVMGVPLLKVNVAAMVTSFSGGEPAGGLPASALTFIFVFLSFWTLDLDFQKFSLPQESWRSHRACCLPAAGPRSCLRSGCATAAAASDRAMVRRYTFATG